MLSEKLVVAPPIIPVVLSGGKGTRLWPLSRQSLPKPFLPLTSHKSMLQETLLRLEGLDNVDFPAIICHEEHRFLAAEQLRELDIHKATVFLEPVGRNTAPAVALAALHATSPTTTATDGDALLLILPADHAIDDISGFQLAIQTACIEATAGNLVTFGVRAHSPHTNYGYIKQGMPSALHRQTGAYQVDQFVEKPALDVARRYVDKGDYLWNSGIFLLKASRYLQELENHCPEMLRTCRAAFDKRHQDLHFLRVNADIFSHCENISIDYAIMEKTQRASVIPLDVGWSDMGSWKALWAHAAKDPQGNAVAGDTIVENSRNCYVHADNKLVALIGLENISVVQTDDAVLVAHKDHVQNVKSIVQKLTQQQRTEVESHRQVHRPWGHYKYIDKGERFQVKHITVKPQACLSLQLHHHRAEHWIVVKGTAKVTRDGDTFLLGENQSVYIPMGTEHRLQNPGTIPLEIIEVQSGSYLGEDDIVRLECATAP